MSAPPAAHILVVEDNEAMRYAITRILAGASFRVTAVATGEAAIEAAARLRPDLVLLDVQLPDMTGFDVRERLKQNPATAVLPIAHLSASHVGSDDQVRGLEGGADLYLTQPIEPHVLVASLHALLRARRAEAQNRQIFASGMLGMLEWAADGRIRDANQALLAMLGYDRADLAAGQLDWRRLSAPEWADADARAIREAERTGVSPIYEKELVAKDGRRVPALVGGFRFEHDPAAGIGFVVDLTDRKRALREREEALAHAREALDHAAAAQRRMALLLRATSALMGEPLQVGAALRRLAELCVPALGDWAIVDRVTEAGELERVAVVVADPAGADAARWLEAHPPRPGNGLAGRALASRERYVVTGARRGADFASADDPERAAAFDALGVGAAVAVPLAVRGRVVGVLVIARRGAEAGFAPPELELADELAARAALALENARLYEDLARAVRAREDALAEASHDLRNPLSSILLIAAHLERLSGAPDIAEQVRRRMATIRSAGERMSRLLQDLLELARLEAGRLDLDLGTHGAGALVARAVEAQAAIAPEKELHLEAVAPAADLAVRCDRERVEQVFENLLGNAMKFSPRGARVEVGARESGRDALFWVRDEGPGIAPDEVEHVFDRYWRARATGQRGSGLGLGIARGIVEGHGGRIWVETALGRGSTFCFTIPRAS